MTRFDETTLAEALLTAPGWARVGLSAPTPMMREDAAGELARVILDRLDHPLPDTGCQEQLPL